MRDARNEILVTSFNGDIKGIVAQLSNGVFTSSISLVVDAGEELVLFVEEFKKFSQAFADMHNNLNKGNK